MTPKLALSAQQIHLEAPGRVRPAPPVGWRVVRPPPRGHGRFSSRLHSLRVDMHLFLHNRHDGLVTLSPRAGRRLVPAGPCFVIPSSSGSPPVLGRQRLAAGHANGRTRAASRLLH